MNDKIACDCHRCMKDVRVAVDMGGGHIARSIAYAATRMILCSICGNKRCPHASDHELPCTDCNDPGQPGSVYV